MVLSWFVVFSAGKQKAIKMGAKLGIVGNSRHLMSAAAATGGAIGPCLPVATKKKANSDDALKQFIDGKFIDAANDATDKRVEEIDDTHEWKDGLTDTTGTYGNGRLEYTARWKSAGPFSDYDFARCVRSTPRLPKGPPTLIPNDPKGDTRAWQVNGHWHEPSYPIQTWVCQMGTRRWTLMHISRPY